MLDYFLAIVKDDLKFTVYLFYLKFLQLKACNGRGAGASSSLKFLLTPFCDCM